MEISPLLYSIAKGDVELVKILLRNRTIQVNAKYSNFNVNAFWLSCFYGHADIMAILAHAGADVYITNRSGVNVLHLATAKNYLGIVQMLIESGFPIDLNTH